MKTDKKGNGYFIISLDFELHWGVHDAFSLNKYLQNLLNASRALKEIVKLADQYEVKLTIAAVGFLMNGSKVELLNNIPSELPTYKDPNLNPYRLFDQVKEKEEVDSLHYAKSLLKEIHVNELHEIATHTYSHYNCLAEGQKPSQFKADLDMAIKVGKSMNIQLESIVFPKNKINHDYLSICKDYQITVFRGIETLSKPPAFLGNVLKIHLAKRVFRLADSYLNLTGYHTYKPEACLTREGLVNLPSSRFLRPYSQNLRWLEGMKLNRIKKAMHHAAKHGEIFHLWWHPHNFGNNLDENLSNLNRILKYHKYLKRKYNFKSVPMNYFNKDLDIYREQKINYSYRK